MHGHALFSEACLGFFFLSFFFIKEHGWLSTAAFTKRRCESWRDSLNDGATSLHPGAFTEAGASSDASLQNLQPAKPVQPLSTAEGGCSWQQTTIRPDSCF